MSVYRRIDKGCFDGFMAIHSFVHHITVFDIERPVTLKSLEMVRVLDPWYRDCPDCGTSFESVQEVGVCPACSLRSSVSREGTVIDFGTRPKDRVPQPIEPSRKLFDEANYSKMVVEFDVPENGAVLACVMGNARNQMTLAYADASARQQNDAFWNLGTHPDLVHRLWHEVSIDLPSRSRWVIWGVVSLLNPKTGIIFGFARGTHNYALRVPPELREIALADGAEPVDSKAEEMGISIMGPDWILPKFNSNDREWAIEAFRYAEASPPIQ